MPASHIHRTHSEAKLHDDNLEAELRDFQMYRRVTTRLRERSLRSSRNHPGVFSALKKFERVHQLTIEELNKQSNTGVVTEEEDTSVASFDSDDNYDGDVFTMDL